MDRVSVAEAADRLGISQDAVYKRIKRGTIPWDKGEDDKTYVWIDQVDGSADKARQSTDRPSESSNYVSKDELLSEMRARVSFLEEELQRKDAILLSLTQRIPELEPSPEPREAPVESSEGTGKGKVSSEPQEPSQRRSWLRAFFGLE
jgi:hypothetical protein